MSVPDSELWWWKKDNKPDKVHCDRNGCDRKATMQVAWRHMSTRQGQDTKTAWRHIACDSHADWWTEDYGNRPSGASVTGWTPA